MKKTVDTVKLVELAELARAAECLKVLAHPVRLRLVDILMQGAFPVGELAAMCELPPHQTSEHLRLMQGHGLLAAERRGREVYYAVAAPQLPGILTCIRKHCGLPR
jgi:ArsR family transcriptional regulator, zinc-responsive transcriptional repressor